MSFTCAHTHTLHTNYTTYTTTHIHTPHSYRPQTHRLHTPTNTQLITPQQLQVELQRPNAMCTYYLFKLHRHLCAWMISVQRVCANTYRCTNLKQINPPQWEHIKHRQLIPIEKVGIYKNAMHTLSSIAS